MSRRWGAAAIAAVGAVVLAGLEFLAGNSDSAVGDFILVAVIAVLVSPLTYPGSLAAQEAQRRSAADGRPVIYWRPGCMYCLRLRFRLGRRARRAHWVDIWKDPEGAAAVREVTGGEETVPTVVTTSDSVVNPDPRWMRELLGR